MKIKVTLSKDDQKRVDHLLGIIIGSKKELGLIIGRALEFKKAPTSVNVGLPANKAKTAEYDFSGWENDFVIVCSEDSCGMHDEATSTCYEL